jgi:hypothetical protein
MSCTLPIGEEDKIRLARALYTSEHFTLIASLLHELEADAMDSIRSDPTPDPADCAAIRAVDLLRSKFRLVAHAASLGDPFGRTDPNS